ncbi:hypothetical protein [Metabacillus sp. RGM 3146]|uniref:hypothetical protein n=1 Tax=Metabacillus sp. RGM 3146 TaxID=3401092 RepID=UPI003B9BEDB2
MKRIVFSAAVCIAMLSGCGAKEEAAPVKAETKTEAKAPEAKPATKAEAKPKAEPAAKEVAPDSKGTVEEGGFKKYRGAEWKDDFKGLVTKINGVSVAQDLEKVNPKYNSQVDGKNQGIFVWFTLENTSAKKFTTWPSQAKLVLEDGTQIDADIIGSADVGGEIVGKAKKDGDVMFRFTSKEDVRNIKSIRLNWEAFDENFAKKDYDVTLPLK